MDLPTTSAEDAPVPFSIRMSLQVWPLTVCATATARAARLATAPATITAMSKLAILTAKTAEETQDQAIQI
jgi:hypothetical protein